MIAGMLRTQIESYAEKTLRSNPLLKSARQGSLPPEAVMAYLFNIHHLIRHTRPFLDLARSEAAKRGWLELADYYAKKADEELGHDTWAANDIAGFREGFGVTAPDAPVRAMNELLDYLRDEITAAPERYLAYILFAEYFTVLVGPVWLQALEQRCGIPMSLMTSVGHHVTLDQDHVVDGLAQIDALLSTSREVGSLCEMLRHSMYYFDRFFDDIHLIGRARIAS